MEKLMSAFAPLPRLLAAALLLATFVQPSHAANPKVDVNNGKTIFAQRCGICHATSNAPGGPVAGPNMVGIIGRKAASVPGFAMYSPALKKYGVTWSEKTLDEFLIAPMTKVPGTMMPMMLPDNKERGDVIAYMLTLKDAK
jgi:cytochrome c